MTTLKREAQYFVDALDDLGYGAVGPVSGADTVDVICNYESLLRKLPALAELADAAGAIHKLLEFRRKELGSLSNEMEDVARPLAAALDKLKGA